LETKAENRHRRGKRFLWRFCFALLNSRALEQVRMVHPPRDLQSDSEEFESKLSCDNEQKEHEEAG
jgi:hypothetical protein